MTVNVDLAHHCLQDLGRPCPITQQRMAAFDPNACDGLSIRDTLYDFLKQAIEEFFSVINRKPKRARELKGQIQALSYAVALIDNPYAVDTEAVMRAARMEVETATSE